MRVTQQLARGSSAIALVAVSVSRAAIQTPCFAFVQVNPITDNAARLVSMAFGMLKIVSNVRHPRTGEAIEMRIGIHTGAIVAGVVGTMTLRYDIWGPDVLAANLIEANGVPSRIALSDSTREALKPISGLTFSHLKDLEVRPTVDGASLLQPAPACVCASLKRLCCRVAAGQRNADQGVHD